jgi:hypothetical protein
MDAFFYVVPAFIMGVALLIGAGAVRRAVRTGAAWRGGATAEARCLRAYATRSTHDDGRPGVTTQHHVYEFTAAGSGAAVRFEEEGGPATRLEGDFVTVHYRPGRPERATAHAPQPVRLAVTTAGVLVLVALMVAFCVYFMTDVPTDDF